MSAAEADVILERFGHFEEARLHEVTSMDGLFTVDLTFNLTYVQDGLRDNLNKPLLVTLRLSVVERLSYEGDLTDGMREHPERVDWGFSEVARVRAAADQAGYLILDVVWESQQRLSIVCHKMLVTRDESAPD